MATDLVDDVFLPVCFYWCGFFFGLSIAFVLDLSTLRFLFRRFSFCYAFAKGHKDHLTHLTYQRESLTLKLVFFSKSITKIFKGFTFPVLNFVLDQIWTIFVFSWSNELYLCCILSCLPSKIEQDYYDFIEVIKTITTTTYQQNGTVDKELFLE